MNHLWKSNEKNNLPDFIIGGAMKSGTTTLHQILDKHPDVFIANDELGFYDMDSIIEHPDFNFFDEDGKWHTQKIDQDPTVAWKWYSDKFNDAKDGQIKGEDSTTYLSSLVAAKRISWQKKDIKMIFLLRHPTERTISNYFHLLKSGKAEYNLEETLQYNPYSIIRRSLYYEQLKNYYELLNTENIKIVLFEDLVTQPAHVLNDICTFLNLSFEKFSKDDLKLHSNKTLYPKSEKLQLKYNRLNRKLGKTRYSNFLPFKKNIQTNNIGIKQKALKKIHKKINPKHSNYKPNVNIETKKYLDNFFAYQLDGLDELTNKKIVERWFPNHQ